MGNWPEQVDHKDGNRANNAWTNLREATASENATNRASKGYYKHTRKGRVGDWYTACIEKDGKKYKNTFRSEDKTREWRAAKERELFGEFRREAVQ